MGSNAFGEGLPKEKVGIFIPKAPNWKSCWQASHLPLPKAITTPSDRNSYYMAEPPNHRHRTLSKKWPSIQSPLNTCNKFIQFLPSLEFEYFQADLKYFFAEKLHPLVAEKGI